MCPGRKSNSTITEYIDEKINVLDVFSVNSPCYIRKSHIAITGNIHDSRDMYNLFV